jgi:hypothetical protein
VRLRLDHGLAFSSTSASDTGSTDSDKLARFDQRQIENLVDQLQQVPARLENLLDARFCGRRCGVPDSMSCANPRMAFSGVRSSWLMLDRNSDFAEVGLLGTRRWRPPARRSCPAGPVEVGALGLDPLARGVVGADQQVADDGALLRRAAR